MADITCAQANNEFIEFSMLLPSFVSKNIQADDFYIKKMVRGDFNNEAGKTYTYPIFGRGVVVGDSFAPFTEITGEATACDRPTQTIQFGSKNGSVTPRAYSQQTELLCLSDLQYYWQLNAQLANTVKQMGAISKFTWSQEYQNVYIQLVQNKLIADADKTTGSGATFPAVAPTSPLTWGILAYVYQKLIIRYGRDGAAGFDPDDRPIFHIVGDTATFNTLKLQDSNVRDDVRWAFATHKAENDPLLATPGLSQQIAWRGWKFNTVDFPARYDLVDGVYVQRFPMATIAGSNGSEWDINPLWENAAYTASVVFLDNVMKHLVVKPTNFPDGYKWAAAQNWAGEFLWKNEAVTRSCNPNGDKGWWQANYVWGAQGLRTDDLGYAIMHKRCGDVDDIYTCPAPGAVTSGR
ncbi:MAG: hypothetical protein WCL08_00140 [Verrucomicrobiota bacterium]